MSTRPTRDLPAGLKEIQRRFERWRRTHRARSRISDSLWAAAVKASGTYGIYRTARALRVDYYSLKKQIGQKSAADRGFARVPTGVPDGGGVATFLEVAPAVQTGSGECTLELEDGGGAKMRVHLKGFEAPDLAALSRSFWNPGP
jgi:hypothetical protein